MCILCVMESLQKTKRRSKSGTPSTRFFSLFQVAFSLPIAFLAILEGSVIKMNLAALAAEDSAVSLKA